MEIETRREMTAREAVTEALDFLAKNQVPRWIDLMADDIVFEFPFAPPGYPREIAGREALAAHLNGFPDLLEVSEVTDRRLHQTADPDTLIVEFGIRGRMRATGRPYDQTYICVVEMRGGRVARYRDYWNPLIALEAFADGAQA